MQNCMRNIYLGHHWIEIFTKESWGWEKYGLLTVFPPLFPNLKARNVSTPFQNFGSDVLKSWPFLLLFKTSCPNAAHINMSMNKARLCMRCSAALVGFSRRSASNFWESNKLPERKNNIISFLKNSAYLLLCFSRFVSQARNIVNVLRSNARSA